MASTRESIYRCVYSSPGVQHVVHVCAWDAEEAAQLLRTELRGDGRAKHGPIEVTRLSSGSSVSTRTSR